MKDLPAQPDLQTLSELERKALWVACWTIHNANHLRPKTDGLKVGGHQASSASLATLMSVLYFHILRPQDRVAVKPHASPVFHAIQYLLGNQTRENLEAFRGAGGAQSYPSRTKDVDDVDFSTGSVGLGGAMALFSALIQDYVAAKRWGEWPEGRMIALLGDAELDEGNLYEALLEGKKHGLRNCWWFIDYNRQSLDAVTPDRQNVFFADVFRAMGWDVVELKYGSLLEAAFQEPGGAALRDWIDRCPNQIYSALTYQGGAAWRRRLMDEIGDQGPVTALIERRSDEELAQLMTNLAGHDVATLAETLGAIDHDRPVCFVTYTIKGHGLPLAGHKDNHAGLMSPAQIAELRTAHGVPDGAEWEPFAGLPRDASVYRAFLEQVPFAAKGRRRLSAATIPAPEMIEAPKDAENSTQKAFGQILDRLARKGGTLAERIVTTSPDVTVSTNLGPWVNRTGLFAREKIVDHFKEEGVGSMQKWAGGPDGRHLELGISEMNLFSVLAAAGLSHSLFGERLIPIGTLYDPFIERGKDMLNYACYQDARFILVATPSGVTLAPEGGAHQSIGTPLIGISQDGLATFEPAFADELAAIMGWSFDYVQRDGEGAADPRSWLRDENGGSVYLRLTTRTITQPERSLDDHLRRKIIDGGYWMRPPTEATKTVLAYTGAVAPEAIAAAEADPEIALLSVTSADRLNAGWQAADRARALGEEKAVAHVERLLAPLNRSIGIVTVTDGHPLGLGWLGSVFGHRLRPLGVEHFGQTGTIDDVYRLHRIDQTAIAQAVSSAKEGGPLRVKCL
ncbi:MAG: transketolase [Pseudomonadota bacterium]